VQYLAELKKEKSFVGFKTEVKLLARSTSENNWQSISNDEIISIPDSNQAKDLKDGQMVLVDINNNKNIQKVQDASKRLVLILQSFTRLQDKFKQGEEEIEQWKQSLNYQSQELHRREVELADREQELEQIDIRRKEVEEAQTIAQRDRLEVDKLRQELDIQRREFDADSAVISQEQADYLRDLTTRISNFFIGTDFLYHQIGSCLETLLQRQETLNNFWQQFESIRPLQTDLTSEIQELNYRKQQLQQTQSRFIDLQAELKADEELVKAKETTASVLRSQIISHQRIADQLSELIASYGGSITEVLDPAEVRRLEQMSTDDLETEINKLQYEFDKGARAVGEQEDELAALEGDIADLQSQIENASGAERIELESSKELAEENYQFLEASVSGMRANMLERQSILNQQRDILDRRQGIDTSDDPAKKILPILALIETEKSAQESKVRELTYDLENTRVVFRQRQESFSRLSFEYEKQKQELEAAELSLRDKIRLNAEVSANEKILQPVQDIIDILKQQMEAIIHEANQAQTEQAPQQLIENLQQMINSLVPN
jgi:DNA repair exonuclease SbcCD ATPase subunit